MYKTTPVDYIKEKKTITKNSHKTPGVRLGNWKGPFSHAPYITSSSSSPHIKFMMVQGFGMD